MKKLHWAIILVLILLIVWFIYSNQKQKPRAILSNPASVFCLDNGGKLDIRTNTDGFQAGYCIFQNNTECEEWAYYRGECLPG